ncbi:alpha/beta hydrolase family protein [Glaciecola sp. SC05]|uniref:alpha/beta hydrolase family protein n=1 Tax=Glaciecola sp. SC05 TaxID=1987355 RepID=UPI003527608C
MNKHFSLVLAALSFWATPLLATNIDSDMISKISIEGGNGKVALADNAFSDVVEHNFIHKITRKIDQGLPPTLFNTTQDWSALSGESAGTHLLRFSISASQFTKGRLSITGAETSSLYLNTEAMKGDNEYDLTLMNQDYRALLMVTGVEQWQDFSIEWADDAVAQTQAVEPDNAESTDSKRSDAATQTSSTVTFGSDQAKKRASMKQYYDSETVGTLTLSPDGELLIWSKHAYSDTNGDSPISVVEIINVDSQQVVYRWQGMSPQQATWRADSKALVFVHDNVLYQLDRKDWQLRALAEDLKGIRNIDWLNNSSLLVSWHKPEDAPSKITKRYRALEDRWSYWRGNLQLQIFDINSGLFTQLTEHELSTNLADLDAENMRALITRNPLDYQAPPHSLTQLSTLNLKTGEEQLIGEYRFFGSAYFHKDGIVFHAGPDFNGGKGNTVSAGGIANNYDGQIYLMDDSGEVTPLSENFTPSISAVELLNNGDMVLLTTDQDKTLLYSYDLSRKKFTLIDTKVEAVSGFSVSKQNKATMVYKGSSATQPESVHMRSISSSKDKVLFDSAAESYANVEFASLKDWDYTTQSGQFIDGRVYYPPGFDADKQYPALIYYYAGTFPVGRSFTGRWPFSMWASHGYVVYVLQPSGTVGYGQDFSARHVNAWGINTADEIIESTQAFTEAHPFVDKNRLGNMGASYGGFMTMYLATQTDIFAASISHAGISNLTSYWGYGWWGYGYSGVATTGSFPWNRSDLYTQQSPVFAADKVTTPILLVHGDSDTNVPVGESHQMFTALKLLDKDVELIEFLGDDHHINKREHRLHWWKTKLAYFDMKLKGEPLWWHSMYLEQESK